MTADSLPFELLILLAFMAWAGYGIVRWYERRELESTERGPERRGEAPSADDAHRAPALVAAAPRRDHHGMRDDDRRGLDHRGTQLERDMRGSGRREPDLQPLHVVPDRLAR